MGELEFGTQSQSDGAVGRRNGGEHNPARKVNNNNTTRTTLFTISGGTYTLTSTQGKPAARRMVDRAGIEPIHVVQMGYTNNRNKSGLRASLTPNE